MLRCPFVGYVGWPVTVISGIPDAVFPSVFSVGPGIRITYGTGTRTATAIAITVAIPAIVSVRERLNMAEDYALPTHSSEPSVNRWCFQIGTEALSSSISAWQAWKASARCGQDTPTTTARSPTLRSPTRCTAAIATTSGYLAAIDSATRRSSASADGCALYERPVTPRDASLSLTAPANSTSPPAAGSAIAARTSSTDSASPEMAISLIWLTRLRYRGKTPVTTCPSAGRA